MSIDGLSENQSQWWQDGIVYKPNFLPKDLIEAYCNVRSKLNRAGGWQIETPYLHIKELRDLCLYPPMMDLMKELIGETMGVHLNLTGWVSTERDWHQDLCLNPPGVGTFYLAAWMALDNIHEDSGPFQFVRGSHRWPVMQRELIFNFLTPQERQDPAWPTNTQKWVADACMEEIVKRNIMVETYLPNRGDLLLWHASLIHRGSPAKVPGMLRKSLIAHYSALSKRLDMPIIKQHDNSENYFWFDHELR